MRRRLSRLGPSFAAAATAAALLIAGCAASGGKAPPGLAEEEIPATGTLARGGLAGRGDLLVVLDDAPARCRAARVWRRGAGGGWREAASGPPLDDGAGCPAVTARLAPDGRTLAVYDYSAGRAAVFDATARAVAPVGAATVGGGGWGAAFPPPGPNLAFSADGRFLLLGASDRGCRRSAAGDVACGTAKLFAREASDGVAGGVAWRRRAALAPPDGAAEQVRFGQTVALAPDAALAVVGGTGQPGRAGALWVYALDGDGDEVAARRVAVLRPPGRDEWFGNDVALSADGSWLAVGAERAVQLYRRDGEGFAPAQRLTEPPGDAVGHYGERVDLAADGRTLLVGAPRSGCAAGERCGLAFLYRREGELWGLAATVRPATERADANFSHRLALAGDGRSFAVQGAALHVFAGR